MEHAEAVTTPSQSRAFNFAYVESDHRNEPPRESCIGISLTTVMNSFRSPLHSSHPASPSSIREEDRSMFRRFRSAVQRHLSCTSDNIRHHDDRHVSFEGFEGDPMDRDGSLMQRMASYGTVETQLSSSYDMRDDYSASKDRRNVQFHYPPITSVKLRPRTRTNDIDELYFQPEELDQMEDDRSDTKAADDIETLAVGTENWGAVPTAISSSSTLSDFDDGDSRSDMMLAGIEFGPSPRAAKQLSSEKRIVRGVQIMLREKSTR